MVNIFNDSFERCTNQPGFFDCFYQRFMASSPAIAPHFVHTDFKRQKRLLKSALLLLMMHYLEIKNNEPLKQLAILHDRHHRNIAPELYDQWLNCLLDTVKQCDPLYDETVATAWRTVLQPGIEVFQQYY